MLTTNESNSYNYNKNNVLIIKIIKTIKMKSGCALKWQDEKIKSSYIYYSPHFYSVKKMLLNSIFVSVKIICCF